MVWTYGREVKFGYGYDYDFNYIYPFKCNSQEITVDERNDFYPDVSDVNSEINDLKDKLGLFLHDESLNYINWLSKYENDDYCLIRLMLQMKYKRCAGCDKYPENISHYIKNIIYGIHIDFCIERNKFLNKNDYKIHDLLYIVNEKKNLSKLTSEQLETKFEVMINWKEEKWMTLKEMFEFFWDKQNIQKYQCAIGFHLDEIPHNNTNSLTIKNEYELKPLMYNLYIFYQKFVNIYDIQVEHSNFDEIKNQLENSKNEFKIVEESDLFDMYKTAKKLFKCYQAYLDYMFKNRLNVDDEDKETFKEWIQKLEMSIKNVNIVLIECLKMDNLLNFKYCQKMEKIFQKIDYPYIFECKFENTNSKSIKEKILKTTDKFDSVPKGDYIQAYQLSKKMYHLWSMDSSSLMKNDKIIKNSDEICYLLTDMNYKLNEKCEFWKESLKKLLKNIDLIEQLKPLKFFYLKFINPKYLIRKCPSKICNDNDEFRRWKCSICDEFMKIQTVECDCGYKQYEELNLYCEYNLRQQITNKLNQFNSEDENKNKQAKAFSYLLTPASEQIFTDVLNIIVKSNINDEINDITKNCLIIAKIKKFFAVDESNPNMVSDKEGYIKYLPVPQKLLNDNIKDVNYLMTKCPISDICKDASFKLHLCFECKKLTKIKTLKCNCKEEKSINSSHFVCNNDEHKRQFKENVKKIIIQQLDKQEDKHRIECFSRLINKSKTIPFIEILELINRMDLDGDTRKFVDDCISNFKR